MINDYCYCKLGLVLAKYTVETVIDDDFDADRHDERVMPFVLAYMGFPADHWSNLHSTNGLERLNGEIKRRTEVVGIFPDDDGSNCTTPGNSTAAAPNRPCLSRGGEDAR
jgi:hypothetical protein